MQKKYMPDDRVTYMGSRFAKDLHGKIGWIIKEIENNRGRYVVEFDDESFVMHVDLLDPYKATQKPEAQAAASEVGGVEIRRNRKRKAEDEE